ncbi:MAG: hypothetical protein AAGA43_13485 [Bacteroidota bacterium]
MKKQPTKGNFVRLATGGPKMEITEIVSEEYVSCSWTNGRNDDMSGSFPVHLLIEA